MSTISFESGSDEWKQWRSRCLKAEPGKFSALYYLCDKVLGLGDLIPMRYRVHWPLCLFVEGATGIPRIDSARVKLALCFRGGGKTSLITIGRTVQQLLRTDGYAVGIANETNPMAEGFLVDARTYFESNELLRALFPERIDDASKTWNQKKFTLKRSRHRRDASCMAAGVDKTVTGAHPDEWMVDDILSQNAAEAAHRGNFAEIEETNRWVTRLEPLLSRPKVDPITFVGTCWWQGDTYDWLEGTETEPGLFGHGQPREEYDWRLKLPDGTWETYRVWRRGEIAVFKLPIRDASGRSRFPERYSDETLELMEQQDPAFFAGQMMLNPTSGGAAEFRTEDLRTYKKVGEHLVWRDSAGKTQHTPLRDLHIILSLDPAFADTREAARTAIPVTATNGHEIFLLEDFAQRGVGVFDIAKQVLAFVKEYRPKKLIIETLGGAQTSVADVIRREADKEKLDIFVEEIKSHGQRSKTWRIYGLAGIFQAGRFYYNPQSSGGHMNFLREFQAFPRGADRDVLDALAFQKDEWERARFFAAPAKSSGSLLAQKADEALQRLRRSIGRGGLR